MLVTFDMRPFPSCDTAFSKSHGMAPARGPRRDHLAPVEGLPGRSAVVRADRLAALVQEVRARRLQGPRGSVRARAARVDLVTISGQHEREPLIGVRFDRARDALRAHPRRERRLDAGGRIECICTGRGKQRERPNDMTIDDGHTTHGFFSG